METLLSNIANHVTLTEDEKTYVLSLFERDSYPIRTQILKAGEISLHSTFILSGILRNYFIDEQGTEHTISFATTDWWIADMYSYLSKRPGNSYIEVVEKAEVLTLCRDKQLELMNNIPKMERYFRILIERSLVANQQRLMDNMTLTAEERYQRFTENFHTIVHSLPQKQIASFIGVTPEFFSKMKKKILLEK